MSSIDNQNKYWDGVAWEKRFSLPLDMDRFKSLVSADQRILDYGCGYGRTCSELWDHGFHYIVGVDSSSQMIKRGRQTYPHLNLRTLEETNIPYDDDSCDVVLLFAVLTCIPTDDGQRECIRDIFRVLRPKGILYISDFCLQNDERRLARYKKGAKEFGTYGVFRLAEGAVLRHHEISWIKSLTADFETIDMVRVDVETMNENPAKAFQYLARKP